MTQTEPLDLDADQAIIAAHWASMQACRDRLDSCEYTNVVMRLGAFCRDQLPRYFARVRELEAENARLR